MDNLAAKYRPKELDDITEQKVVVDIVRNICNSDTISNRNFLFIGPAGTGKAEPLDNEILTTSGFKKMGDLTIGDELFTGSGNRTKVSEIYPQGKRSIYKISLSDGTSIKVSDEHLNVFYTYEDDLRKDYCMTTKEMIDFFKSSSSTLWVDCPIVDWQPNDLKIDPYLLGVLICSMRYYGEEGIKLHNVPIDVAEKVNAILNDHWGIELEEYISSPDSTIYQLNTIDGSKPSLLEALKDCDQLTLTGLTKHIPDYYLMNSYSERIQLLRGMFDVNGVINHKGQISFYAPNDKVSKDFAFLVRSLGIQDTQIGPCLHRLTICDEMSDIYTARELLDKQSLVSPVHNNPRKVESIKKVGHEHCQCIMVDHPDHTYISSRGFIPTHNTTTARIIAKELNGSSENIIEIDAASHSGVDSMRDIINQARVYPVGTKYKVFVIDECHALSSAAWQSALLTIESQPAMSVFCWCTTNPEKIPATILSRVQTFQLSKISLNGIYNRLKYIIEEENKQGRGITYDDDAVMMIAKMAQGGMRDGITSLDQCLAYSNNVTIETVISALDLPNYDDYFDLLNAIAKKDNGKIVEMINTVYNSGVNFVKWFDGFFSFITNIVKFIYLQDIQQTMIPSIYEDKISKYGTAHSALCLKLSNKLAKMNQELKTTQYLQELAISYLCTPPAAKKG